MANCKLKFLLFTLVFACWSCDSTFPTIDLSFNNPDGSKSPRISVEVVSTGGARSLGLMYRKKLPESQGMLFVFAKEEPQKFWMKNTYIELDIIYLNAEKRVISIIKRARPLSTTSLASEAPAKYTLEVAGGLAEKWHLTKGSQASFNIPKNINIE